MNDEDFYNNIQNYLKEWEDFKDLALTHKKLDKLQSNWNSLREWLEDYLERNEKWFKQELSDHDKEYYKETYNVADYILDKVLDKMNELEGVDNENN